MKQKRQEYEGFAPAVSSRAVTPKARRRSVCARLYTAAFSVRMRISVVENIFAKRSIP